MWNSYLCTQQAVFTIIILFIAVDRPHVLAPRPASLPPIRLLHLVPLRHVVVVPRLAAATAAAVVVTAVVRCVAGQLLRPMTAHTVYLTMRQLRQWLQLLLRHRAASSWTQLDVLTLTCALGFAFHRSAADQSAVFSGECGGVDDRYLFPFTI